MKSLHSGLQRMEHDINAMRQRLTWVTVALLAMTFVSCSEWRAFFRGVKTGVTCLISSTQDSSPPIQEPSLKGLPVVQFTCGPILIFTQAGSVAISFSEARTSVARRMEQQRELLASLDYTLKETRSAHTEITMALGERSRGARPTDDQAQEIMDTQRRRLANELMTLEDRRLTISRELHSLESDAERLGRLPLPENANTLITGTWKKKDDSLTFQTSAHYRSGTKIIIPFAVRNSLGAIEEVGSVTADHVEENFPDLK